jgi:hypothetical protein
VNIMQWFMVSLGDVRGWRRQRSLRRSATESYRPNAGIASPRPVVPAERGHREPATKTSTAQTTPPPTVDGLESGRGEQGISAAGSKESIASSHVSPAAANRG